MRSKFSLAAALIVTALVAAGCGLGQQTRSNQGVDVLQSTADKTKEAVQWGIDTGGPATQSMSDAFFGAVESGDRFAMQAESANWPSLKTTAQNGIGSQTATNGAVWGQFRLENVERFEDLYLKVIDTTTGVPVPAN